MGNNTGKKYIKLTGDEKPTDENKLAADNFLKWYADNIYIIKNRLVSRSNYDDEIVSETILNIYECIALKGFRISNPMYYFLRAYQTNKKLNQKKWSDHEKKILRIDSDYSIDLVDQDIIFNFEIQPDFSKDIIDYINAEYDPLSASLMEMYLLLQPDISYRRLAKLIDYPASKIWPIIGNMKKDIKKKFGGKRSILLST